uniref:Uncharacterized protein n=2 Tax=root TaxID=1 RepID=A0A8S5PXB1_9CAUD|nr:MAG TPA: hypothetical protein [Peduovirinae sp. ctySy20]
MEIRERLSTMWEAVRSFDMAYESKRLYFWLRPFSFINVVFYFVCVMCLVFFAFFLSRLFMNAQGDHYVSFVALLAALATITTLIYNLRRHISEDYFKDAKEYLKRAYDILEPELDGLPPNDRMSWLDAARLLGISERLGDKILMDSHKESYNEEREFWRSKFRKIIKDFPDSYYCVSPDKFIVYGAGDREPIAESSIYSVHKFIAWNDDYVDPLPNVSFSIKDISKIQKEFPRLAALLRIQPRKR